MAVPKRRQSPGRRDNRRSQWLRIQSVRTTACAQCKASIPPHSVCPTCGTYRGRTVIDTAAIEEKRMKKEKQRQREATEEGRTQ